MSYNKIPLLYIKRLNKDYFLYKNNQESLSDFIDIHFAACRLVARALNMKLSKPTVTTQQFSSISYLQAVAEHNVLRMRRIRLKNKWWQNDAGPFIGFFDHRCCALLPKKDSYELVDCKTGERKLVNEKIAQHIHQHAYIFYPALPEKNVSITAIIKFTFALLKREIRKVIFFQIIASLLLTMIPIVTGIIFEQVIPYSNYSLLVQYATLLVIIGIVISLMSFIQKIILLRIRLKAQHRIQAAIWDKLLKLPASFFKKFTAGDLSFRVGVISLIQEQLGEHVISTIIGGILSITYLGLMFFIDFYLALVTSLLVLIMIVYSIWINTKVFKEKRKITTKQTQISSTLLGLLTSISKIRVAHKEKNAFQLWEKVYAAKTASQFRANQFINRLNIFTKGFMGVSTLIIYALVIWRGNTLSFSDFIIFNAAFIQFFYAILDLVMIVSESLEIIPLFKKAKPIFDSLPEQEKGKSKLHALDGHIVMRDIVFRYPGVDKPLFTDLTIEVQPGAFVAFVGPSGSGKSTIFRLLLGLDFPESGIIKYSGIDLKNINLRSLRSQIGVVMQSTQLIPGTIYENICGNNTSLTREQALEIARHVGLGDFLQNLPMGIDTLINDGIQMLSGGEIQRINMARAISTQPKILLLDEATSALDNKVQAQIQGYLNKLKVTRLVIAHRFSTIVDADIIYVIQDGRCVEVGNYQQLMAAKGLFYQLSTKQ
ncbi:ABC transporter [Legionella beliardensis]|uniref:ABC transporter n=1 Tax=Legionella beliardensis TaxID=91822 RepID=A0A378I1T2_9GAMM|nr:ATP-binding cassette domain-containing protein [Legionella beliardensis]STX28596.1 ABC transporter [Legionella beliardensis]